MGLYRFSGYSVQESVREKVRTVFNTMEDFSMVTIDPVYYECAIRHVTLENILGAFSSVFNGLYEIYDALKRNECLEETSKLKVLLDESNEPGYFCQDIKMLSFKFEDLMLECLEQIAKSLDTTKERAKKQIEQACHYFDKKFINFENQVKRIHFEQWPHNYNKEGSIFDDGIFVHSVSRLEIEKGLPGDRHPVFPVSLFSNKYPYWVGQDYRKIMIMYSMEFENVIAMFDSVDNFYLIEPDRTDPYYRTEQMLFPKNLTSAKLRLKNSHHGQCAVPIHRLLGHPCEIMIHASTKPIGILIGDLEWLLKTEEYSEIMKFAKHFELSVYVYHDGKTNRYRNLQCGSI